MKRLGIIVGGGPAPGINGVISAVTIEARNRGFEVFGICNGFTQFARGDMTCIRELQVQDVSRIDSLGGSVLGTSKTDPTREKELLETTVRGLKQLNLDYLVTIGGEGTASVALTLAKHANLGVALGHVPKTIDNDVPLPPNCVTFGFETAREYGARFIKSFMTDAKATDAWYIVVAMGRHTGHLALGIGTAARAPLTIIPEEFGEAKLKAEAVIDIMVGAMLKRLASGRRDGVVVIAEGVAMNILDDIRSELPALEHDPHGNIRLSDINLSGMFRDRVLKRLRSLGVSLQVRDADVGFELRCADPIAYDREYTLQLGYGIVDLLAAGHDQVMVCRQGDALIPVPFSSMYDEKTGMSKVRYVDLNSVTYRAALKYMLKLTEEDLGNDDLLTRMAANTNLRPADLRALLLPAASRAETYSDQDVSPEEPANSEIEAPCV